MAIPIIIQSQIGGLHLTEKDLGIALLQIIAYGGFVGLLATILEKSFGIEGDITCNICVLITFLSLGLYLTLSN